MRGLLDDSPFRLKAMRDMDLSYEELLELFVATERRHDGFFDRYDQVISGYEKLFKKIEARQTTIDRQFAVAFVKELNEFVSSVNTRAIKKESKRRAKLAADAKHSQPGGYREKTEQIRAVWRSGDHKTKAMCAEKECEKLGMAFSTALRALRNIPKN